MTWSALRCEPIGQPLTAVDRPTRVGRPDFTPRDARVLAGVSRSVAEGIRQSLLVAAAAATDHGAAPGLLMLGRKGDVQLATPAAARYLDELGCEPGSALPLVVRAVAAVARRSARSPRVRPDTARARGPAPCRARAVDNSHRAMARPSPCTTTRATSFEKTGARTRRDLVT